MVLWRMRPLFTPSDFSAGMQRQARAPFFVFGLNSLQERLFDQLARIEAMWRAG